MDFDKPKVYGDTSISDGLVSCGSVIDRVVLSYIWNCLNLGKYSQIIKSSHGSLSKPCHSFPTFIFIGGRTWSERDRRSLASLHLVDSERVLSETRTTVFNRPPTREELPSPDLCQIQIQRFSFFRSFQLQIQSGFF